MNACRGLPLGMLAIANIIVSATLTAATGWHWNPNGSGGDGNWGTSPGDKNWNTTAGAPAGNTFWPDTGDDVAIFADATGGTVTVFDPVQAAGIVQQGTNYSINAGTITLVRATGTAAPFIDVRTGILTIDSVLAGTDGLLKNGAGSLVLSGTNTFTGTTSIAEGTLTLTGSLAGTRVDVAIGGVLSDQSGGLADATVLTNAGRVTVDAAETVATYVQENTQGRLDGSGSLSTTHGATLVGGVVAGTLLGNTTVSTGRNMVTITGTTGGGTLLLSDGSLEITGTANNPIVDVMDGRLTLSGNNIADTAALSTGSGAVVELLGNDTVATYAGNGGTLAGGGTLTAASGATLNEGAVVTGNLRGATTTSGAVAIPGSVGGGTLTITGGTLDLTGMALGPLVEVQGGRLILSGDNIADTSVLAVQSGALVTVNGNETVGGFTLAGTLDGPGTLTAPVYSLRDGAVVNGHLGEGVFDKADAGTVMVNGTVASDVVAVPDGRLVLAGHNLEDTAAVIVGAGGVLQLDGTEHVATFTSNGGTLAGPRALTATVGAALNDGSTIAGILVADAMTTDGAVLVSGQISGGPLTIRTGTLTLTGTSAKQSITIASGATLLDHGGIHDSTPVSNSGTLTMATADTVRSYVQHGRLDGPGGLTVTDGATLAGGEVAGTLLGDITSTGDVLVSGLIGGGSLAVSGGTLNLTGASTNTPVTIAGGATLVDRGDLGNGAEVTNHGILTVHTADAIGSYVQHGRLDGPGTLTATGGALLAGGEVVASLLGDATSTGTVLVSGTLGGGSLAVTGGVLTLTGGSTSHLVSIAAGARLVDQGDLGNGAVLSNQGSLAVEAADTVGTYAQLPGGRLEGPGALTSHWPATLAGGEVAGTLLGDTFSTGAVRVSGRLGGGALEVMAGELELTGSAANDPVTVHAGARLWDRGDLGDGAFVTNLGTLTVDTHETIGSYFQHSMLDGPGTLTVTGGASLAGGEVAGTLLGDVTSTGAVLLSGTLGGGSLAVTGGTLTITGHAASDPVVIGGGATVLDRSPDALADIAAVTNSGRLVLDGAETVGVYQNQAGGSLWLDVASPAVLDRLLAGAVTLDPGSALVLETSGLRLGELADILDGPVTGTFTTVHALAGPGGGLRYSFNPNDGTIQALPGRPGSPKSEGRLLNLSDNQTMVIGSAFEDTHVDPLPAPGQPATGNFRKLWFRDTGNPDPALRWQEIPADQARPGDSFIYDLDPGLGRVPVTPGSQAALLGDAITAFQSAYDVARDTTGAPVLDDAGVPVAVVTAPGLAVANSLSPEVHHGMADFTRQAMRSQQRAAMAAAPLSRAGKGDVFAALHSSTGGADSPRHAASYDIDVHGAVAGARYALRPDLLVGGMLGSATGNIEGPLIDTDGCGSMLGVFGEYLLDRDHRTTVFAGAGYGWYEYDAVRRSFGGSVRADGIDSRAVEAVLGIETLVLRSGPFRLLPRAALRYLDGSVDGFTEHGDGVQLKVGGIDIESCLLEAELLGELDLHERATLRARLGFMTDLRESGGTVRARYVAGATPFGVVAPGADEQAVVAGLGIDLRLTEQFHAGFHWRGEFRSASPDVHLLSLGGSMAF